MATRPRAMNLDRAPQLLQEASNAIQLATQYAQYKVQPDGHWCGPLPSNATVTAEWIFFLQAHQLPIDDADRAGYILHFLSTQETDGSWAIAPEYPDGGNLSCAIEAYFALKMLGVPSTQAEMAKARDWILSHGGIERMRNFTRIFLAMFGLLPWSCVPQMPPELILLPSWFPGINVYRFASWARVAIIPFTIIRTREPVYALPVPEKHALYQVQPDFLDELWLDPGNKSIPYRVPILDLLRQHKFTTLLFQLADLILCLVVWLRLTPLRNYALSMCTQWLLDRQEASGNWAGLYTVHLAITALLLHGHMLSSEPVQRGIADLGSDGFLFRHETQSDAISKHSKQGLWMQSCVSPVWDTFLMVRGLLDTSPTSPLITNALVWARPRQITTHASPKVPADWSIPRPRLPPGGWAFEYNNTQYPDVDDTVIGLLDYLLHSPTPAAVYSPLVTRAATWILGMQNKRDGGWAAFDTDNDSYWLNELPFSDMDALCDGSSPDAAGHVLEGFGVLLKLHRKFGGIGVRRHGGVEKGGHGHDLEPLFTHIVSSSHTGIAYLERTQEPFGGWFGRWASNYLFGTSNVLCGLAYFIGEDARVPPMVRRGLAWLQSVQNEDGGWGEGLDSYVDIGRAGRGKSTPSQTAWALMGLMPYVNLGRTGDGLAEAMTRGVEWLVAHQDEKHFGSGNGATWSEDVYTGTGFPGHFYLGYDFYRHYFPMMALGRHSRRHFLNKSGSVAEPEQGVRHSEHTPPRPSPEPRKVKFRRFPIR
ncbi:terpenoid cyclases/protein prenyltransferase alpha-alpha toroid [Lasiosphaeris hirsuta]|uniref:Terpene cyclase/mutase family member n=1 Tax=Lasiosphaeris hirsuta TaxID=260670 RepID=A0AA39ZVW1_9PEZI|nr:terpenoid cyclases/protein prenyltransferase alpha-alpha toroid [Lasiosphaeris hirsuta]